MGTLDLRVLSSYFPDVCGGALFDPASVHAVDVFADVVAYMPPEPSVYNVSFVLSLECLLDAALMC